MLYFKKLFHFIVYLWYICRRFDNNPCLVCKVILKLSYSRTKTFRVPNHFWTLGALHNAPWSDKVNIHVSDDGTRADLNALLEGYQPGWHVYTCGPDRYMNAVLLAAEHAGFPDEARHLEYFSVPEMPEYVNRPFTLRLSDGREFVVPEDKSATDVLAENGVHVDVKCADGICGVCKCKLLSGVVEHRDYVLSKAQRQDAIILCQSRAAEENGVIEIEL